MLEQCVLFSQEKKKEKKINYYFLLCKAATSVDHPWQSGIIASVFRLITEKLPPKSCLWKF